MKYLYKVLGGMLMFGLLAMIPTGCSDSDNSSPVTPDIPTNRIYVMTIGSGVLSPAIESTGGVTELNGEPVREYILTLDDVTGKYALVHEQARAKSRDDHRSGIYGALERSLWCHATKRDSGWLRH